MSLISRVTRKLNLALTTNIAHGHCDVPCGIYDPHLAQIAALTVVRMSQLIRDLPKPDAHADPAEVEVHDAKLARFVAAKEHHAEVCKQEVRIIWGDYFRPEHVEQYPNLHDLCWNHMKQASKARQEVDLAAAEQLLASTQEIAEIFWKTKGAQPVRQPSRQTVGGELVYPG